MMKKAGIAQSALICAMLLGLVSCSYSSGSPSADPSTVPVESPASTGTIGGVTAAPTEEPADTAAPSPGPTSASTSDPTTSPTPEPKPMPTPPRPTPQPPVPEPTPAQDPGKSPAPAPVPGAAPTVEPDAMLLSSIRTSYLPGSCIELRIEGDRLKEYYPDRKDIWTGSVVYDHAHNRVASSCYGTYDGKFYNEPLDLPLTEDRYIIAPYYMILFEIGICKIDGKYYFDLSSPYPYRHNVAAREYLDRSQELIGTYTRYLSESDKAELRQLISRITSGLTSDYDKVLAIARWVSDNIYYDMDVQKRRTYHHDIMDVFRNRYTVCIGYANLTAALMNLAGYPCVRVEGVYNNTHSDHWHIYSGWEYPSHVWNEVYVDGRWIMLDTNWNSLNEYRDGKFIYRGCIDRYFDVTLEFLSVTHKIYYTSEYRER